MPTNDKVTKLFCMADGFREFLMQRWENTGFNILTLPSHLKDGVVNLSNECPESGDARAKIRLAGFF